MNLVKKVSLIFIGILISFLVLEIVLQLAGFIFSTVINYKNDKSNDNQSIVILCLGESTTYRQWPPILQKILNKKSKNEKFKVIDTGIPGINTSIIAANIKYHMLKYQPDIVILMTGINDTGIIYRNYKIKSLNLISLISKHLKNNFMYDFSYEMFSDVESEYFKFLYKRQYAEAEKQLLSLWGLSKKKSPIIYARLFQLYYLVWNKYNKCDELLKIQDIKLVDYLIRDIIDYLLTVKKYSKEQIREYLICNQNRFEYTTITEIAFVVKKYNCEEILYNLKDSKQQYDPLVKHIKLTYEHLAHNTAKNYLTIVDTIYEYNPEVYTLPMQYPTLSVQILKDRLNLSKYYDKLIFIDNKEVFNKALKIYKTEDIFKDMFAGSFGHCTELGNTIIAENAAETILSLYDKE